MIHHVVVILQSKQVHNNGTKTLSDITSKLVITPKGQKLIVRKLRCETHTNTYAVIFMAEGGVVRF